MREDIDRRAVALAEYILEQRATVRGAAAHFGISKSTVHKDLTRRLEAVNRSLYLQVQALLAENLAVRHLRGGEATKRKYKKPL